MAGATEELVGGARRTGFQHSPGSPAYPSELLRKRRGEGAVEAKLLTKLYVIENGELLLPNRPGLGHRDRRRRRASALGEDVTSTPQSSKAESGANCMRRAMLAPRTPAA